MNEKKIAILRNLNKEERKELRGFCQRILSQADVFYPEQYEGIMLNFGNDLGERLYSTVFLKKRLEEILTVI